MSKHSKHGKHSHFKRLQKHQQMQQTQINSGVMQPGAGFAQPNASSMQSMQPSPGVAQPTPNTAPVMSRPVVASPAPQATILKKPSSAAAVSLRLESIGKDLRMIGILSGIIVVALIVLYIFLR
jgi:hypothetical protein